MKNVKRNRAVHVLVMILILLLAILAYVFFLSKDNAAVSENTEVSEKSAKNKKKETYSFRDVKGNEFQAELLENVPRSKYKAELFKDINGYKYYTDKSGNITSTLGIDVSEYQNKVDWNQVKEAGIEFAIIRVGYRGYGQAGKLVEDAMFRNHVEGALNAGLKVGVYFFSQAVSETETLEEAQFVMDRIKEYDITYPVVFDTEEITYDTSRTEGLSRKQFTDNCITFCEEVEKAGYSSMIYANMKWMAFTLQLEQLNDYKKWYADYEAVPQCPYEFQMWQYTESGSVPGIEGNVDLNVAFSY